MRSVIARTWLQYSGLIDGEDRVSLTPGYLYVNVPQHELDEVLRGSDVPGKSRIRSLIGKRHIIAANEGGISALFDDVVRDDTQQYVEFSFMIHMGDMAIFHVWYRYQIVDGEWVLEEEDLWGVT